MLSQKNFRNRPDMPELMCYDCYTAFDGIKKFEAHCKDVHVAHFKDVINRFCIANDPSSRSMAAIGPSVLNLDAHCVVKAILLAMTKDCDYLLLEELRNATFKPKQSPPYEWYIDVCPDDIVDPDMYDSDDIESDDSAEVFRYAEVRVLSSRVALLRQISDSCWTMASIVASLLHYNAQEPDWLTRCVINHMYYLK